MEMDNDCMKRLRRSPFAACLLLLCMFCKSAQANTPEWSIPFSLSDVGHVLIRARVNGAGPFTFIMDTGAPTLFLSPEAAKKAEVTANAQHMAVVQRVHLENGPTLQNQMARVVSLAQLAGMNNLNLSGEHLDGVMGFTLLSQFQITLDLSHRHMLWKQVQYHPMLQIPGGTGRELMLQKQEDQTQKQMRGMIKMAVSMLGGGKSQPAARRPLYGFLLAGEGKTVVVKRVLSGGPASLCGIEPGDRLIRLVMPGRRFTNVHSLPQALKDLNSAASSAGVVLVFMRGAKRIKTTLTPQTGGM